jgi:hypothetical protein
MFLVWQVLQLFLIHKIIVFCEVLSAENDFNEIGDNSNEMQDSENIVLDSVYDTMKHNYEIKLRQNLEKLNVLSDIRNKRNINEPMNLNALNNLDYLKNHQFEIVNRKNPETFSLGFKNPTKLPPLTNPNSLRRNEYYMDEDVG